MLQRFFKIPESAEFTEFQFRLGKTPLSVSPARLRKEIFLTSFLRNQSSHLCLDRKTQREQKHGGCCLMSFSAVFVAAQRILIVL